ncbi:hypothetical protein FNV43_RR25849 [Rhamnella rubrinervis]|uniref:Cytochrome P450 n=1 Tax=Rhamnella rubrinervis TaxID=2594499 RepID=A0A8K0DN60_9ROSA|nr:hypothetical protein FNV43_RR25849 [Rhamnella rubrinervis]
MNNRDREDLVYVLLREQRRHDLELPITDDNLKALLLDMFLAGTDTASTTLEWTKVVKEAMRLHPPVPFLVPRESIDNCNLDGYQIPAKTRVLINIYAIGRDPESWEDPTVYNPERFEDDSTDFKDQDFRFPPFGSGRRGCPGSAFGLAVVEIALARLLYHFDWALPQGIGPDEVDTDDVFGLTMKEKSALVLVPTTNKDYELKGIDAQK